MLLGRELDSFAFSRAPDSSVFGAAEDTVAAPYRRRLVAHSVQDAMLAFAFDNRLRSCITHKDLEIRLEGAIDSVLRVVLPRKLFPEVGHLWHKVPFSIRQRHYC